MVKELAHVLQAKRNRSFVALQASFLLALSSPAVAQFSPAQDAAFAVNVGRPAGELNLLIAGIILTFVLLGLGAISYAAYSRWADGRLGIVALAGALLRASALVIIAGIFLR